MNIRDWFGRNERAAVTVAVVLILAANALGFLVLNGSLFSGSRYDSVTVTYTEGYDGMHVAEHFVTTVASDDSFRVLYRSLNEGMCAEGCTIKVLSGSCRSGTPYVNENGWAVLDPNTRKPLSLDPDVQSRIKPNEFGCYSSGYAGTTEVMDFTYIVADSAVTANHGKHAFFSNDHFAIRKLTVTGLAGTDTASGIPANKPISIDTKSGDISVRWSWYLVFAVLSALVPFLVYRFFGTDPDVVVPEYLHTIPNPKREAWEVAVLVQGENTLPKEGIASILLSLELKGIAKFKFEKGIFSDSVTTEIFNKPKQQPTIYEYEVLATFKGEQVSETATSKLYSFKPRSNKTALQGLFKSKTVENMHSAVYDGKGHTMVAFVAGALLVLAWTGLGNLQVWFNLGAYFLILVALPRSVFSRFKGDSYREYLQWLSFKQMLSDYAKLQNVLKEDAQQWRTWIGYAVALGVTDELMKAMKELKVLDPKEFDRYNTLTVSSLALATAATASSGTSGGGGGGGGFGGGGGGGR